MDSAVENLKKTSDIKRKATLNKLHNMYWLKNTSHSANPEKIKSVVYKQKQEQDEDNKVEDKLSLTETIKASLVEEPDKYSSIDNTCKKYLSNDTMPENDKNMGNKDTDTANLFSNADKLVSQKDEEEKDMLSIVESIVTAKLEAEFCTNKKHKDQSSTLESNAINVTQDAVCTNVSDLQKSDGDTEELKSIKQSDGNNNHSKPTIPYISKINNKQKQTCKTTGIESSKASIEAKDKDVHIKTNTITKTSIKARNNTNVTKDNEKSSTPNSDSKKAISNSSKSFSSIDKNARVDQFNNKHNARSTACLRKQEFVKQHNVSRSGIEKETKNVTPKSNLVKTGFETTDTTYQSKNINKDKALQKQQQTMSKQFASKLKGQEFLRKNASPLNLSIDKNKIEKATHIFEKTDLPLNERKSEKNVNEKNFQSDQKMNCAVNPRKNTTFVMQYKNSTFSKPTQNIPKDTGHTPTYRRNPSYACNNPKFDKERNGSAERRVTKKEHTPINTFTKSNTRIEESKTNNLENCTKQKKEIIYVQPKNVKSTCVHEVDTLVFNDTNDINPVKVETDLIENKESMKLNVNYIHTEQRPAMSEQSCEKTNDISKVDTDQQHREMNNEKINPFKHSSNLTSDKYITDSQANVTHHHSLKSVNNMQHTNDVKSSQTIWSDQSSDNAMRKGATVVGLQQSIQQHFNTEQTFIQAGNPTRQISPWEQNNKFYDLHFSANDRMQQLSQIPNTFSATPYECNVQMSNDSNVTAASMLETTMNSNRENSNVPYRCVPNIQQRPVMALSDFPSHHVSSCQTNQARWNSSIQDGFHIDYPYVATQPTTMHMYNPGAIGPDDFNNTHTMDYVSHPIVYAASPYMQTWNPQLQYPLPIFYNTPCTNYTAFPHTNQTNNFNNAIYDQQHKHIPGAQVNNYVRDTYNDMNTCVVQSRNVADNVPIKSNYYCKKYQDNCRAVYDVPQYVAPVSHSRPQQGMNFMPTTGINQYNASYCPSNQKYKQNTANYMKNPKNQIIQDFACDDNGSEDIPPIISPKEFVTNNVNLSNKSDQFATHMFKSEFKTKSDMGYRPPSSLPRYNGGFRRNTTFQDFPKEYTYPISIGRGTYKTKKT